MKLQTTIIALFLPFVFFTNACGQSNRDLKIVLIRHGEKANDGDNLSCQGLNRSLQLPALITKKFGVPDYTFVTAMDAGKSTKHSRMFQTVTPLAVKYNLKVNSSYEEKDARGLAKDVYNRKGTVLIVWEHEALVYIAHELGANTKGLVWPDDDFDSIWIITYKKGDAVLTKDKEGLKPAAGCPF